MLLPHVLVAATQSVVFSKVVRQDQSEVKQPWFKVVMHSGKLSRQKTFVIFKVFVAIVFSAKFGSVTSFRGTSEQSTQVFYTKIVFSRNISPSKVPRYTIYVASHIYTLTVAIICLCPPGGDGGT